MAVLEDARNRGGFDQLWVLGDTVGYGPDPGACIELLRQHDCVSVVGNHDLAAVGMLSTRDFNSNARIAAEHVRFLSSLPEVVQREDFTMVHGSLRSPVVEYLVSPEAAMATFRLLESRFCIVGHSHIPFICRERDPISSFESFSEGEAVRLDRDRLIINPGGVGQPRDGDPRPSYAMYDSGEETIERHRVSYEIEVTQGKMHRAGLPEALIERLSFGL